MVRRTNIRPGLEMSALQKMAKGHRQVASPLLLLGRPCHFPLFALVFRNNKRMVDPAGYTIRIQIFDQDFLYLLFRDYRYYGFYHNLLHVVALLCKNKQKDRIVELVLIVFYD
jgi:hypothetical protein